MLGQWLVRPTRALVRVMPRVCARVPIREGLQAMGTMISSANQIKLAEATAMAMRPMGGKKPTIEAFTCNGLPQFKNRDDVVKRWADSPILQGINLATLTLNERGLEEALSYSPVKQVTAMLGLDTGFMSKNNGANQDKLFERATNMAQMVVDHNKGQDSADQVSLYFYVSTIHAGRTDGDLRLVSADEVAKLASKIISTTPFNSMKGLSIALSDTTGTLDPNGMALIAKRTQECCDSWQSVNWAFHPHDTMGNAIENVGMFQKTLGAHMASVDVDLTPGGIGGCPYSNGATGNLCAEDFALWALQHGWQTNIDAYGMLKAANMAHSFGIPTYSKFQRAFGNNMERAAELVDAYILAWEHVESDKVKGSLIPSKGAFDVDKATPLVAPHWRVG